MRRTQEGPPLTNRWCEWKWRHYLMDPGGKQTRYTYITEGAWLVGQDSIQWRNQPNSEEVELNYCRNEVPGPAKYQALCLGVSFHWRHETYMAWYHVACISIKIANINNYSIVFQYCLGGWPPCVKILSCVWTREPKIQFKILRYHALNLTFQQVLEHWRTCKGRRFLYKACLNITIWVTFV
jgi:hypothetical protein